MKCPGCGTDLIYFQACLGHPERIAETADGMIAGSEHTPARCTAARLTTAEVEVLRGLVARYEELLSTLGCADGSCWFKKPTGMHTNGGCRCFQGLTHQRQRPTERLVRYFKDAAPILARLAGEGT